MKRISILAMLAGCLALAPITAAQADTKIGSSLKVKYRGANPDDPYGTSKFTGKVGPRKCGKGRKVTIEGFGKTKTEPSGRFDFTLSQPAEPGRYKVKVAARTRKGVTCTKVKATVRITLTG